MSAQPLEESRFSDRELLGVLAERVGGMKETFDEFRDETRKNFESATKAAIDLRTEMRADALAIRTEMREGFSNHDRRITSLEKDRDTASGGIKTGRWLWGFVLGAVGFAGTIFGWLGRGQ